MTEHEMVISDAANALSGVIDLLRESLDTGLLSQPNALRAREILAVAECIARQGESRPAVCPLAMLITTR